MDDDDTMNTLVNSTKENVSYINKNIYLFLKIVLLLRVKKIERFRMKRCLEEGEAVMAVNTSLCELISCLFIDVVITCVEIRGTSLEEMWILP